MTRKFIFKIAGLLILLIFIVVSLSFTTIERKQITCKGLQISFDEPFRYVALSEIENIVHKNFKVLNGAILDTINTDHIERKIEENQWVKKAEVFKGYADPGTLHLKGGLKIHIVQEKPLLRVMHGSEGYYVNENGKHLPFSSTHTVNVVVVTGNTPDELIQNSLLPFVKFISNDPFWKAQVQQVHVLSNQELILVPRAGGQMIEFGKAENIEKKFRNLKAVYKDGFSNVGWDKYKTISLKFENQVVCTLK